MAEHGTVEIDKATGDDYAAHLRTYRFFLGLTKYSVLAIVIILILMAFFLL
jgi:hypothetical protein